MRGVGEATGAITIVNALSTGIGAAVGVRMSARAEVELHPAGSSGRWDVDIEEPTRTPLVVASLTEALRRCAPGSSGSGKLQVLSDIPTSRGLKSSSAVSSAIVLAVARATDSVISPLDVARVSADVSISVGLSATGAFDDALAGLTSGIVVTDNRSRELLASFRADPQHEVVLFIPESTHRPSPDWAPAFVSESREGKIAADAALRGDWAAAMNENTLLVERVMGYDYAPLRTRLARAGALACGVSGMGPSLAAVAPRECVADLVRLLPDVAGERRIVAFAVRPSTAAGDDP